jgi:hypothetical protein
MSRAFHRELLRAAQRNAKTLNDEIMSRLGATYKSDALPETMLSRTAAEQTKIVEKTAEKLAEKIAEQFSEKQDAYFKKLLAQYGWDDPEKQKQLERKLLERFEKEAKEEPEP